MLGKISLFILRVFGWKITGHRPEMNKILYIGAPHTSWWDFVLGLLVRSAWKLNINFVGKHNLFKPPFGFIFRALGGYPVDRSKRGKLTDQIAQIFKNTDKFAIMIAPEGTRKKVASLKSGFYYIAKAAEVPIVMITINGKDKLVNFSESHFALPTWEEEEAFVLNHYKGVQGINPENGL